MDTFENTYEWKDLLQNHWTITRTGKFFLKKFFKKIPCYMRDLACRWRGFAAGVLQVVLFTVLCFKWSVKRHSVAKILQGIWERFHKSNPNYVSASLVTSSLLSLFRLFIETKNKNQLFSKSVVWQREIVLLFVYSELCCTSKVCRIQ